MVLAPNVAPFPYVVLFLSLHAIYSMSFLELWALADGGYSLSILDCLDSNRELPADTLLEELAKLGTMKKQIRVADLVRLGLVRADDGRYALTASGRRLARFITVIIRVTHVKAGR
jgi:hypothetical protein